MPRIPSRILTNVPQGSANPRAPTSRVVALPSTRTLGPAQPRIQFRDYGSNRTQSAVIQSSGPTRARYDADHQIVSQVPFVGMLTDVCALTNGSASIVFTAPQTLARGTLLAFTQDPTSLYVLGAPMSGGTTGALVAPYTGTSSPASGISLPVAIAHGLGRAYVGACLTNPYGGFLSYYVIENAAPQALVVVAAQYTCTADVVVW